ncbi:MAG: dTDP-4-dehydrorhamnose 3,5-epimerase family protein [Burkholderiaceae bacterium]
MPHLLVSDTPLAGVKLVRRQPLADERGCFARMFCTEELADAGWQLPIAQINVSRTRQRGTVRGLHYQRAPHAEMKLVSCLRGAVWDVALDLRVGSPTFLQWHAQQLSADNGHALLIPEGCAHGFQSLSANAELLYCHSSAYVAAAETGLHALDPRLDIAWPLPVILLSERDQHLPGVDKHLESMA